MDEFTNKEISKMLSELADLLEIKGENKFKVRAYSNIARKVSTMSDNIVDLARGDSLEDVNGIGEGIAGEIKEIFELGFSPALEELKTELPSGVLEMIKIPGIGPKSAHKLFYELEIQDLTDLKKVLEEKKVRKIKGFGPKTEKKLLKSLNEYKEYQGFMLLDEAENKALEIINTIRDLDKTDIIDMIKLAGSIRRKKELIGDIDILISTAFPDKTVSILSDFDFTTKLIDSGNKKVSIMIDDKIRVDFRLIASEDFASAIQHFTGSQEHNVRLRQLAKENGYKLNEYGLFNIKDNNEKKLELDSEKKIYKKLGLDYIIPELREDRGEIESAAAGELPHSIKLEDIKGDLHIHSRFSDGAFSMREMIEAARKKGYNYLAITDHSQSLRVAHGMTTEKVIRQRQKLVELRKEFPQMGILNGIEVDILNDGSLDYSNDILAGFDLVIASIHTGFKQSEEKITGRIIKAMENPYVDIIAHPQGRILTRRRSYKVDMDKVIADAAKTGTCLEINASPNRLDLDDKLARKAKLEGVKMVINTDAHHIKQLADMKLGITVARRGWLEKGDIINTMDFSELTDYLK